MFILNVFREDNKLPNVTATVTTLSKEVDVLKYKNFKKVNDLISLFSLARTYCSEPVKNYQRQSIRDFIKRAKRNEVDYKRNVELTKMIIIFEKIVDIL